MRSSDFAPIAEPIIVGGGGAQRQRVIRRATGGAIKRRRHPLAIAIIVPPPVPAPVPPPSMAHSPVLGALVHAALLHHVATRAIALHHHLERAREHERRVGALAQASAHPHG